MADSDNSMGHLEEESMLIDHSPAIHCDLEESNEVFNEEEEMLVAKMFKLVGERWSLIAGRIPGRTADEIEKYWTSMNYSSEVCDDK